MWVYECGEVTFMVRGGPEGPEPFRFDLSLRVAANIDAFLAEANAYLATWVVPERFGGFGPWELQEGFEFGRRLDDPADVFDMHLYLGNDIYGAWGVRFGYGGALLDRFYAREFWRRQE